VSRRPGCSGGPPSARANRNPFLHAVYLKQYLKQRPTDSVALQQLQVLLGWNDEAEKDATSTATSLVAPTGLPSVDTQQMMAGLKTGGFKASDRAGERPMTMQTLSSSSSSDPAVPIPPAAVIEGPDWTDMVRSWVKPAIGLLVVLTLVGGGLRFIQSFIQRSQQDVAQDLDLMGGVESLPVVVVPTQQGAAGGTAGKQTAAITRGRALAGEQKWLAAVAQFDKAIEMDATSVHGLEALLERGRTHLAAGIPLAARSDFELVVTRAGKDSPYGREAERELMRLSAME
jgi:hypothetical protein